MSEQDEAKQLNGKPDWETAPEWAMWLAQDGSPSYMWFWFEEKPVRTIHGFLHKEGTDWMSASYGDLNLKWQETLERRPSKQESK